MEREGGVPAEGDRRGPVEPGAGNMDGLRYQQKLSKVRYPQLELES